MVKERCGELKRWLSKSAQELTGLIIRIEEFVGLKANFDRIGHDITMKKEQIGTMAKVLLLLEGSKYANLVPKEDKDIVNDLTAAASQLNLTLNDVENQMPKYVERFKKEIKQTLEKF
jgi:hypothetical protein